MVTKVTDAVMDLGDVQQDIVMNNNEVTSLPNPPTGPTNAASKEYVDGEISDATDPIVTLASPPGSVSGWAGAATPDGWLLCDGASYDSVADTTLAELYSSILTTYGGSGASNFNVPDLRGRFPLGEYTGGTGSRITRTQAQNVGQSSGSEDVLLGVGTLPSHSHSASIPNSGGHIHSGASTGTEPDHTHEIFGHFSGDVEGGGSDNEVRPGGTTDPAGQHSHPVNVPTNSSSHSHPVTIGYSPANSTHENSPPFLTIQYIIKT